MSIHASGPGGLLLGIAVTVAIVLAFVRIVQKAGYSGLWVLVLLVPVLNVVMLFVFAFSEWPMLRRQHSDGSGARGAH
ncbi:MAG: hypothetical protein QOI07_3889 [Verrucomicrobiota bacterium]|jgi:hypothetical protein